MPKMRFMFILGLIGWIMVACAPVTPIPQQSVTATPEPTHITETPTLPPSATLPPSPAPTEAPTPAPEPTVSPQAIIPDNVDQLTRVLTLDDHQGAVWGVAASPDGLRVASASADRRVRVFETVSGALLFTFERHRDLVYGVAFSPDGSTLVSGGRDRTMQIWDPIQGGRIGGARTLGEVYRIAFSADGARFGTVGFYSATGEVWQAGTGAPLGVLDGHHTRLRSIAYDPSGMWMATGDEDGVILVRDSESGVVDFQLNAVDGEASTLAFSLDGKKLAVGTSQGTLVVFDLETHSVENSWAGHLHQVTRVLYTPDGRMLISSGIDGTIHLWDAKTGKPLGMLTGHGATIRDIALSTDGATLISGGDDWRVFVWRVSSN